MLQVALNLSTSTKPFDSVTAAHLLNLLLHQLGLQDALLSCIQEQNIPLRPPALNQSQVSEASTLEQNTLAGILDRDVLMHGPTRFMPKALENG